MIISPFIEIHLTCTPIFISSVIVIYCRDPTSPFAAIDIIFSTQGSTKYIMHLAVTLSYFKSGKGHDNAEIRVPDSKVHGANMGPTWVLSAPDGPHVGPMNLVIRGVFTMFFLNTMKPPHPPRLGFTIYLNALAIPQKSVHIETGTK